MLLKSTPIRSAAAAFIQALVIAAHAVGQPVDQKPPPELRGVDITEHLDDELPLDLKFVDEEGDPVTLRDYFEDDIPVIITLNYYRCPMLCTLQLNGMVEALKDVDFTPGEDYRIVTVSFDPTEGPDLARAKKKIYVQAWSMNLANQETYDIDLSQNERQAAVKKRAEEIAADIEGGWAFLTGDDASIKSLTETIGFGYRWNEKNQEWAHAAACFVITPDGRISRYLYGLSTAPKDMRFALLEASEGKIGSTIDRLILWCFHYDDTTGQYTPHVMNIMRLMGGLTVTILATGLFILWRRDATRRIHDGNSPHETLHALPHSGR